MAEKKQTTQNLTVNILKGICIALVVMGHYAPVNAPEWYDRVVRIIYTFHMPAFMWASGFLYVISIRSGESYFEFQKRKFQRLFIPYVIVSILIITIKLVSQSGLYVENPTTLMSYLRMFIYPEAAYFLWYIWALLLIFLVVPFFSTKQSRLLLLGLSIIVGMIASYAPQIFCLGQAVRHLPYFCLGMFVGDYIDELKRLTKLFGSVAYLVLGFVLLSVPVALALFADVVENRIYAYVAGLSGTVAIICLSHSCAKSKITPKCLLLLGEASFVIYLFHTTIQGFFKAFIYKLNAAGVVVPAVLDLTLVFVLTIALTITLFYVMKKNEVASRLFGLRFEARS